MNAGRFQTTIVRGGTAILIACLFFSNCSAVIVVSDGFGDGDRDNNGLDAGATATDPSDVGIPWLLTDGTSAVLFQAVDDSAGIGTGNALQLNNTGSNNRPSFGRFSPIALADGDKLILRLDLRLVSMTASTSDRNIRFGLYRDVNGDNGTVDHGSTNSVSVEDVGYNARVDAGADTNSSTMDVTRDNDAANTAIIQATTTGISVSTSNTANRLTDALKHHFELTLMRNGTGMQVSLIQDSNPTISNTDSSPPTFTFDEVALGVRSATAFDVRWDNIEVEYIQAVPEAVPLGVLILGLAGMILQRRRLHTSDESAI